MNKARVVVVKKNSIKSRLIDWLWRYLPAEVSGIITAYLSFFLVSYFSKATVVSAFAAAWGENIGFYAVMIVKEVLHTRKNHRGHMVKILLRSTLHIITEFGPAELLDSLLLRPLFMGLGIYYLGSVWGIMLGKFGADITFYIPVVISYEMRKLFYQRQKKRKTHERQ